MKEGTRSWISLLVLAGFLVWTTSAQQEAKVPARHINAKQGSPSTLSCESQGIPIAACIWERNPGTKGTAQHLFLSFLPGKTQVDKPGYTYAGDGLEKGFCGLQISRVDPADNGKWGCILTTGSGVMTGEVNLSILQRPSAPQFDRPLQIMFEDNNTIQPDKITCFSTNGVPRPKFLWYIGDEPLVDNLSQVNDTVSSGQTYTFQELKSHKFSFKDNGKKLRCVVVHEAISDNDLKEVSMKIDIRYQPRAVRVDGREMERGIGVQADLGEEKVVALNVSSNPSPRVVWTVGGKTLEQGATEKYETVPVRRISDNIYEVSLKIKSVAEEDLSTRIDLKILNEIGQTDYTINVKTSSNGSDGLSAAGILGIVFAILVLVILVAIGVVYTRARGLLCFKGDDGTASEKERMDGDSTGGAAPVEEKQQTPGFASRLTAFYENLVKRKEKGTAVPMDEEAQKEKGEKEGETEFSKEPEKKGDDIVYAELDLVAEGQRPEVRSDDKTEYAEIVGVVSKGDSSPKKTPQSSPKK